jgi:hypothetical protein
MAVEQPHLPRRATGEGIRDGQDHRRDRQPWNFFRLPGNPVTPVPGNPMNGIHVEIPYDVSSDPGEFGGGRDYNTSNVRTRLVQ